MANIERLNFQLPEKLPDTQEITQVRKDPYLVGRRIVGIVTAYERETQIPSHISILGSANLYEGWKAWYRAKATLPEIKGIPKIDLAIPYQEQIKNMQDKEWNLFA